MNNLFSNYQLPIKKDKILSERAELIKFFVDSLYGKDKMKFPAKRIAVKLSHIPTKDLYFMKSTFIDIINRQSVDSAQKWFWWSLKVK